MSTTDRSFAVHEVYPYLRVRDAARALDFYKQAFGAEELFRLTEPSGRIGHAELKIGGTTLMLAADAFYGERSGSVRDPFGHEWLLGHQVEDVVPQEMQRRYTALFEK